MVEEAGQVMTGEELDVQEQARRRLALAQIRQYPDPVLRMRAHEVAEFDHSLHHLIERMSSLMADAHGAGLAATQVGILRRLFVFVPSEGETRAVVNPEIVERSSETEIGDEGCLSMQRVLVPVERHVRVTVVGKGEDGHDVRHELEGMPARIVQHEVDHLDGVLIIDRTNADARRDAMATLRSELTLA